MRYFIEKESYEFKQEGSVICRCREFRTCNILILRLSKHSDRGF